MGTPGFGEKTRARREQGLHHPFWGKRKAEKTGPGENFLAGPGCFGPPIIWGGEKHQRGPGSGGAKINRGFRECRAGVCGGGPLL